MQPSNRLNIRTFRGYVRVRKTLFFPLILGCFLLVGQSFKQNVTAPPAKFIEESKQFTKLLSEIMHGIVYCYSGNSKTTGFFVSDDGWIITAGHKVDKDFPTAEKIYVKLTRVDGEKIFESEQVVSPPQGYDLLLLKIDYKPKYYFKTFKDPHLFEENWIIGFRGVANICVSPPGYAASNTASPELYYTTASIYYGNSGSPVFNRKGEVLGVAVQGVPMGDGLFVPASVVEKYIKESLEEVCNKTSQERIET